MAKGMVDLIKKANTYLDNTKTEITAGSFKDKFGKPITFGEGLLKEGDYSPINYEDGISPSELSFLAQFASWQGDTYETGTIKTDNQIQATNAQTSKMNAVTARMNATNPEGSDTGVGEGVYVMDLTGKSDRGAGRGLKILSVSDLTTGDIASIDPSLVDPTKQILQLSKAAKDKKFVVQPNGDVTVYKNLNDAKEQKNGVVVTKDTYQKNAAGSVITYYKERKGQEGNPFTNTGGDENLTDAQYFIKYKKARK
jgi:co-chaperonin GroES (HSP10)